MCWTGCCCACVQEAYSAVLATQVAEVQVDCLKQLVHVLCSQGEIDVLCRLPYDQGLMVSNKQQQQPMQQQQLGGARVCCPCFAKGAHGSTWYLPPPPPPTAAAQRAAHVGAHAGNHHRSAGAASRDT